jgi:oxygen-independent coproporphyrinogen-3 oxidase
MLVALEKEIRWWAKKPHGPIRSIYFGGGTPSLLSVEQLQRLLKAVYQGFTVQSDVEITLEVNPDDVSENQAEGWQKAGVNRLSMGIQSLQDAGLKYMNRIHTAASARAAIGKIQQAGFSAYSLDLIYGVPARTTTQWEEELEEIFSWRPPHLSAYALTVEPDTPLAHFIRRKKAVAPDEEQTATEFERLMFHAEHQGYLHYETSNFCLPGRQAVHNSGYWDMRPCIAIGPSAHGWDGKTRYIQPANNLAYVSSWKNNQPAFSQEILEERAWYHEWILTRVRTFRVPTPEEIDAKWGKNIAEKYREKQQKLIKMGWIEGGEVIKAARLFGDRITLELMFDELEWANAKVYPKNGYK